MDLQVHDSSPPVIALDLDVVATRDTLASLVLVALRADEPHLSSFRAQGLGV